MLFFRHLPKSHLWSQFLLGMVAIFVLPTQPSLVNESESEPVVNQQVLRLSDLASIKVDIEQSYFLPQLPQPLALAEQQAVEICQFFAKDYAFDAIAIPPIRAGPSI